MRNLASRNGIAASKCTPYHSFLPSAIVSQIHSAVYSAAISKANPELVLAQKNNIPTLERADFLGELTRCFENTICISGTHGKTTSTSMVSLCFLEGLKDPSIQVGAYLKQFKKSALILKLFFV